jgi:hypothetical protein
MTEVNPRNAPIALILGGSIILGATIYAVLENAQRVDSTTLGILVFVFVIIGVTVIGLGAWLYYWNQKQHWAHSLFH